MLDYNILNRASFEKISFEELIKISPGFTKHHVKQFPDQIFCAKSFKWSYGVSPNEGGSYGWPKCPLQISITNIINNRIESPLNISPPILLRNQIEFSVYNPASIYVTIHMSCDGILVTPKDSTIIITDKEIFGYILLDDSQKGMLALSEAAVDRLDEALGGSLRKQLLGGQLGPMFELLPDKEKLKAIKQMTNSNQISELADEKNNEMKQLKDDESLVALLIGDLIMLQSKYNFDLNVDEIQELARLLITKGWQR